MTTVPTLYDLYLAAGGGTDQYDPHRYGELAATFGYQRDAAYHCPDCQFRAQGQTVPLSAADLASIEASRPV